MQFSNSQGNLLRAWNIAKKTWYEETLKPMVSLFQQCLLQLQPRNPKEKSLTFLSTETFCHCVYRKLAEESLL